MSTIGQDLKFIAIADQSVTSEKFTDGSITQDKLKDSYPVGFIEGGVLSYTGLQFYTLPNLTTNTSDPDIALVDSEGTPASLYQISNNNTSGISLEGLNKYAGYDLTNPVRINHLYMTILATSNAGRTISYNITVYGSNTGVGVDEISLGSLSDAFGSGDFESFRKTLSVEITDLTFYKYVYAKVTTYSANPVVTSLDLEYFSFDGSLSGGDINSLNLSGSEARSSDNTQDLTLSAGSLNITNSADWADGLIHPLLKDQFPAMTGNALPSPEKCWATSEHSAPYPPWQAFNKTQSSTSWISTLSVYTGTLLRAMTSAYSIDVINMAARLDANSGVAEDFTVVYTTDDMSGYTPGVDPTIAGISYTTVLTVVGNTGQGTDLREFILDSPIPTNATAWGIVVTATELYNAGDYLTVDRLEGYNSKHLQNKSIYTWVDYNNGSPRYLFDDLSGSNIADPKRRVGSLLTDAAGAIRPFTIFEQARGVIITKYTDWVVDHSTNPGTSWASVDLSIPEGLNQSVKISIFGYFYLGSGTLDFATTNDGTNLVYRWAGGNDSQTGSHISAMFEFIPVENNGTRLWFRENAQRVDSLWLEVVEYSDERLV